MPARAPENDGEASLKIGGHEHVSNAPKDVKNLFDPHSWSLPVASYEISPFLERLNDLAVLTDLPRSPCCRSTS